MVNAANIISEYQFGDVLIDLGFKNGPVALSTKQLLFGGSMEYREKVICRLIEAEQNHLSSSVIVAIHPVTAERESPREYTIVVYYYDYINWMFFDVWDYLPTVTSENSLRKMILDASSEKNIEKRNAWILSSVRVTMALAQRLAKFVAERNLGWLWDHTYVHNLRNPNHILYPDAFFVRKDRLQEEPKSPLMVVPELVIERIPPVNRPSDRWSTYRGHVSEYLGIGVERVWSLDSENQRAYVFHTPEDFDELQGDNLLQGEGTLAGFQISVDRLMKMQPETVDRGYPLFRVKPTLTEDSQ